MNKMDSDDNQIERLYQLLLELQSNCEEMVNAFNQLQLSADHEFYKTNKSPDFIIDSMRKGKIVTNDTGRA
jgi:hypothetical protein